MNDYHIYESTNIILKTYLKVNIIVLKYSDKRRDWYKENPVNRC